MGVFARLLRRSKATAETPAAEARTDTATAGAEEEAAEATGAKGTDGAGQAAKPADEAAAEVTESEGVDIPKQQSTEKAADNEAGEGART
ncbi:hypothetical protein GCM10010103_68060 [Streptomyces paradoxus]|uniref:Protein-tyrosine-phosphatase n=1 Tax=Streptomyces paradoxus TaxID=66375 RepID=A0A7W9THL8_9ACTN|nr:hypothetical protein [Streptomyces paradoxus]MBB6080471.1 protein-tyrosine-phosphatase [Streptomyces paradoxus]